MNFLVNIYASASRIGMNSNPECQAEQRSGSTGQRSPQPGQSHPCEISSPCLCCSHQPTALPQLSTCAALTTSCQENPQGCPGGYRSLSFPMLKHEADKKRLVQWHSFTPRQTHTLLLPGGSTLGGAGSSQSEHTFNTTKHVLQCHFPWRNIQRLLHGNCQIFKTSKSKHSPTNKTKTIYFFSRVRQEWGEGEGIKGLWRVFFLFSFPCKALGTARARAIYSLK